ncbi:MAG: ABC transporter permease subunit [Oscillospiraceae bacterium]|nr:ABC transporter permease subunit [Oscillospiraceae bacterium]
MATDNKVSQGTGIDEPSNHERHTTNLLDRIKNKHRSTMNSQHNNILVPEEVKKLKKLYNIIIVIVLLAFILATIQTNFNPVIIFAKGGNFIDFVVNDLTPPNFKGVLGLGDALLQTIAMSMISTFFGGIIAFCLCFFASYQTAPHPSTVKIVRGFASMQRNIPNTIWLFIFRMTFGIGTTIGMVALLFNTTGRLTRMFAEVVDEVGKESMEALDSVGAGYLKKLFQCVIPASIPGFVSWLLYSAEINIRAAGVVGALGGGGIGLILSSYLSVFRYKTAFGIILIMAATTILVSLVTDYLRKKVLV